jgi:hypothetical protein
VGTSPDLDRRAPGMHLVPEDQGLLDVPHETTEVGHDENVVRLRPADVPRLPRQARSRSHRTYGSCKLRRASSFDDSAHAVSGDYTLDGCAVRVSQVGSEELRRGSCQAHCLAFERLANPVAATIDRRADLDLGPATDVPDSWGLGRGHFRFFRGFRVGDPSLQARTGVRRGSARPGLPASGRSTRSLVICQLRREFPAAKTLGQPFTVRSRRRDPTGPSSPGCPARGTPGP